MLRPQILVIGDSTRTEMLPVRVWLAARQKGCDVRSSPDLPPLVTDDWQPDFVVVCQSWPDEFLASQVSRFLGFWPLAQWVVCYGAWCDSDGRTRTTWPIGLRVPVALCERRLNHLWSIVLGQGSTPMPMTASRDEAFEFEQKSFE